MRASTFTTYFNSELAPGSLQAFDKLTDTAVSRFGTIARAAEAASRATAGVIGGTGAAGRGGTQARELKSVADAERAIAREAANATRATTSNATALRNQGREARQTAREVNEVARSLRATATSLNIVQGPLGPLAGRVSAIASALEELTGFRLGLAGVGAGLFSIGRLGNTYTLLQSKLLPFYDTQQAANRAMDDAIRISERARAPLESSVALYARLASVANEYGLSQARIARTTELASKAATISGGTPALQKAGLEQFAQAIGNGRLNGDELVSIMTNIPQLAMAIARGFQNVDGSIGTTLGSLRKLGEEGQLTTDKILSALDRSGNDIEAKFARIPVSLTTAGNAFSRETTVMVGRLDQAVGFTSTLAQTIQLVADNLRGAVGLAVALGAAFAAPRVAAGASGVVKAIDGIIDRTVLASRRVKEMDAAWLADLRAAKTSADARVAALNREQQEIRETITLLERKRAAAQRDYVRASPSAGFAGSERRMVAAVNEEKEAVRGLITERRRLDIINRALADSYGVAGKATGDLDRATANVGKRMGILRSAASSLVGFMGGPWGIAFTAATTALYFFATRTDEAKAALDRFAGGQDEVQRRLGITIQQLRNASAEARNFAIALAEGKVAEAKSNSQKVGRQLAGTLREASFNIGTGGTVADRTRLNALADWAKKNGGLNVGQMAEVTQIQKRNPRAFEGTWLQSLIGRDPAKVQQTLLGAAAATLELSDAEKALNEARKAAAPVSGKPGTPAPTRTKAQLAADAQAFAARSELERAQADLAKIRAGGKQTGETDDAYVERLGTAIQRVRELKDAEAAARKARSAGAAAARKEEREAEAAARKAETARKREIEFAARAGEKRNDILGQWSEEPRAIVKAMDQIDDLQKLVDKKVDGAAFIGKTAAEIEKIKESNPLGTGIYTQAMADGDARRIEEGVRRPLRDVLQEQARNVEISRLLLQGREAEARALETAYRLYDDIGELTQEQYEQQVAYEQQQERINALLQRRERIVAVIQDLVDGARDSFEQFLMDLPERGGGAVTDLWKSLQQQIWRISARSLTERLFAGTDEKVRALLSGRNSVDNAIHQFSGSIGRAETGTGRLATATETAADRIEAAADRINGIGTSSDVGGTAVNAAAAAMNAGAGAAVPGIFGSLLPFIGEARQLVDAVEEVVVTAPARRAAAPLTIGTLPSTSQVAKTFGRSIFDNIEQMWNEVVLGKKRQDDGTYLGKDGSITTGSKFFAKMGDVFGGALKGAGEGAIASGFAKAIGVKQSSTGAAIGGAIGNFLPIPGGGFLGGLIGGTLGGLFQKPKWGSAGVSLNQWGEVVGGDGRGRGGEQIKAAAGAAGSVASGINQVMETLGATISSLPGITIGTWDGKARVALTETSEPLHAKSKAGKAGLIKDFGEGGEEEAIAFAVRYAIEKGVITGISQASVNILKSGQDLQQALNKALAIESIPKRLMQRTDPVRYAVTELNTEFEKLIKYLQEGGATAQQFADAQKLYELERAEAIEQATNQAASAIDQYLKDMVGSQSSPLNKRTTYENAASELNKFRTDVMAGKVVDQNELLSAARNFQDASRALFGSGQSFFSDFDSLRSLLERARDNAGITDISTLPASPFATDVDVQNKIAQLQQGQITATQDQTAQLASRLDTLIRLFEDGGASGNGYRDPINLLPGFLEAAR